MNLKVEMYGLEPVSRPKIKATKVLDLSGESGRKIIESEARRILKIHRKTFEKLARM